MKELLLKNGWLMAGLFLLALQPVWAALPDIEFPGGGQFRYDVYEKPPGGVDRSYAPDDMCPVHLPNGGMIYMVPYYTRYAEITINGHKVVEDSRRINRAECIKEGQNIPGE